MLLFMSWITGYHFRFESYSLLKRGEVERREKKVKE